jgi:hypothetical protein
VFREHVALLDGAGNAADPDRANLYGLTTEHAGLPHRAMAGLLAVRDFGLAACEAIVEFYRHATSAAFKYAGHDQGMTCELRAADLRSSRCLPFARPLFGARAQAMPKP